MLPFHNFAVISSTTAKFQATGLLLIACSTFRLPEYKEWIIKPNAIQPKTTQNTPINILYHTHMIYYGSVAIVYMKVSDGYTYGMR